MTLNPHFISFSLTVCELILVKRGIVEVCNVVDRHLLLSSSS